VKRQTRKAAAKPDPKLLAVNRGRRLCPASRHAAGNKPLRREALDEPRRSLLGFKRLARSRIRRHGNPYIARDITYGTVRRSLAGRAFIAVTRTRRDC